MIKSKNKTIVYNIASTIILQGLAFISGPIFSKTLGPNNYGIASVYLTWVQLASTVFSLQAAGTIAIARVNYPLEDQPKYQSSVISLATIAYAGFSFLTIICVIVGRTWININIPMVLFGLAHGWGLYCVTFMNSKFTYEFKADKNFVLSVLVSILTIGVSIILIRLYPSETNYWGRIIGQASVYFVIGIILVIYILINGKTVYNKDYWKFTLPISIPTIFHLLASLVLGQSDKVMLQRIIDNSSAGIYALAGSFGLVLYTIYGALNNSWVPFYYEYTKNNEFSQLKRHSKNYLELFTVITVGFIFLAKEVFHVYASIEFWDGTDLIPLFALGYYFVFLYSFAVNYEFYNKKTKVIAIGTGGAAIGNILLNYIFIHIIGLFGAIIATTIAHGFQFVFHYLFAKRIKPGEFPYAIKDFLPWLLVVCLACGSYYFIKDMWVVRWSIGAVAGIYLLYKISKRREIF